MESTQSPPERPASCTSRAPGGEQRFRRQFRPSVVFTTKPVRPAQTTHCSTVPPPPGAADLQQRHSAQLQQQRGRRHPAAGCAGVNVQCGPSPHTHCGIASCLLGPTTHGAAQNATADARWATSLIVDASVLRPVSIMAGRFGRHATPSSALKSAPTPAALPPPAAASRAHVSARPAPQKGTPCPVAIHASAPS